ncbi:putative late blight resistance protein homolog R1A-3 [Coffea eugenioides]|uniref:putative late blight resistance protein homolog R1A-3 n=1 Tax=Coffea eugenioides TaxID=49369 RepID=UPI000F604CBE|nr:putative late blight resistance protein homolog R1A-3 [Coffea eugenioides]
MEFRQLISKLIELEKSKRFFYMDTERFFDMDIKDLCERFLNPHLLELPLPDVGDNQIYFIVNGLMNCLKLRAGLDQDMIDLTKDLLQKLKLSKNILDIATMQGVDPMQLIYLLAHYTFMVINAKWLRNVYLSYFYQRVPHDIQFQISQLHRKIELVDPQFHATSVHVMKASKELSRSPLTFVPEKNKYIVAEFVDSLLGALRQILDFHITFMVPVQDHILNLHEGVKSISILLHVKQENFNALPDKMKDHIGVVIIDLGIVICSISVNEIKHGLAKGTDLAISRLVKDLQFVMQEVAQTHPPSSSSLRFPRTNELGSIDFFLENLQEIATSEAGSIASPKDQIQIIQEDLLFLRSFLQKIAKQRNQNVKFQALWDGAMEVAYKAEFVIDSVALGDRLECLDTVAGDIKHTKTEALKVSDSIRNDDEAQRVANNSIHFKSQLSTLALNEVLVGLDEEVKTIADRLTRGSNQLDIVSIVGMAGLGKTTLANTIYHHPSILGHFHFRAWCTISQVYSKQNLLVQILSSIGSGSHDQYIKMHEDDLVVTLFQLLKRNRYLIILDDVWDIGAWNLLERSLPNDANGSRILFTSRIENLSLQFKSDSQPHHLCHLSDKECLELLLRKIFGKEDCPPTLIKVLMQVANKCKGLPHTVVIFAGILSRIEPDCWQEFADSLNSNTSNSTEPLELSYIHLPEYLKPCLLYIGAFREDQDIPVRKLSWLWISEGFVQKIEGKSLDDVAEDYLKDLIGRSLVMVTEQRTLAGAKICRLHDLVHDFVVAKAKKESFLQISYGSNDLLQISNWGDDLSTSTGPSPHRLCMYSMSGKELAMSRPFFPGLRCLLYFGYACMGSEKLHDGPIWFLKSKLLRVLDFRDMLISGNFPSELLLLVHLRYLAISLWYSASIPSAIDNLSRLHTFLVGGNAVARLPNTIWNIKTLRHLRRTESPQSSGSTLGHQRNKTFPPSGFTLPTRDIENSPNLDHLDSFSLAINCFGEQLQKILKKLPSIRRLKCVHADAGNQTGIVKLDSLSRLESLQLHRFYGCKFEVPMNLKKLTLSRNKWPWSEISTIGKLPNLEVLKLEKKSFMGEKWEMQEGEFSKLRFLELSRLNLCNWTAYNSDNFSHLEKLVLYSCLRLEEVPLCLGESSTIEMIEVEFCRKSLVSYVEQIQQEQMEMGNQDLKVVITHAI